MPAYLPNDASIRNTCNFILNSRDNRNLYFGLGRNTTWGAPDTPPNFLGTQQEKIEYWDNLIGGIRRIDRRNIIPVVPRRTWAAGQTYVTFDPTNPNAYNSPFYMINSLNQVYTLNTSGPGVTASEPELENVVPTTGLVTALDGYIWRYQYTASSYEMQQVEPEWMPINFSETTVDLDLEENKNAINELGCRYVLLIAEPNDTIFTDDYRQIGLVTNPKLTNGTLVSTTDEVIANLEPYSGELIYIENRFTQSIISGQEVNIKIILRF